ncbi:SDR family oxidoreductase [Rhodococcus qingshengii]|uniref:SDR family NAD(P)-dependent oxidoreductase n=1 Tax=Rhodococcus qingshengii TaxID=334542 RepID=UPI0024B96816|nr:SDR family oxidoreductase [Rhodococcus qingshengii]MDJ0490914.1 SDR family oxidoreductase [Rhodococcus qingshengii]
MTNSLEGKIALVTGGARGIGEAIAERFAQEGAVVIATDISFDTEWDDDKEHGIVRVQHDVSSEANWKQIIDRVESEFGPLSILVNNAGVIQWNQPIAETSVADYRRTIDINQGGVFLGLKHGGESIKRAGGGSIVNFSSTAGLIGYWGLCSYVASKWAVRGMTKTAAIELGPFGITVNSVHPGFVRTEMTKDTPPAEGQPISRYAEPAEMAEMVLFLASDRARYSTGAEFIMDGGHTVGKTVSVANSDLD